MWDNDSYRDFLSEHASKRHTIGSWLIVLVVAAALLIMFAEAQLKEQANRARQLGACLGLKS